MWFYWWCQENPDCSNCKLKKYIHHWLIYANLWFFKPHLFKRSNKNWAATLGCRVTFGELLDQAVGNSAHELLIWFFDQPVICNVTVILILLLSGDSLIRLWCIQNPSLCTCRRKFESAENHIIAEWLSKLNHLY